MKDRAWLDLDIANGAGLARAERLQSYKMKIPRVKHPTRQPEKKRISLPSELLSFSGSNLRLPRYAARVAGAFFASTNLWTIMAKEIIPRNEPEIMWAKGRRHAAWCNENSREPYRGPLQALELAEQLRYMTFLGRSRRITGMCHCQLRFNKISAFR
jgi:hypothetical protein